MELDEIKTILGTQVSISLETLRLAMEKANDQTWTHGTPPFWQISLHVLNSLDEYYSCFIDDNDHPEGNYYLPDYLNEYSIHAFFDNDGISSYPSKRDLMTYYDQVNENLRTFFSQSIEQQFDQITGFSWLPFTKFEMILHNIRHINSHVGVLNQYLKENNIEPTGWLGRKYMVDNNKLW